MRQLLQASAAVIGLGFALGTPTQAISYPIDCAILLCMAGGFPSDPICTAAKVEMIRRITPLPVEPPLQLWRCPMGIDPGLASEIGLSLALGPDGLTPEARAYRDGIEIYHIVEYRHRIDGEGHLVDNTLRGEYREDGQFQWVPASYRTGPAWLAEATGGRTITQTTPCDDSGGGPFRPIGGQCNTSTETVNELVTGIGRLRGVFMRFRDWQGNYTVESIRY